MLTQAPRRLPASRGTISVLPLPFGIGFIVGGVCVTLSSVVGLIADSDAYSAARAAELVVGLAAAAIGYSATRLQAKTALTRTMAMAMFVTCWASMTLVAILAFWLSGELESPLDAVFEAVSASTTTGFTTVERPEELSHAFRFLRMVMPWATGVGVLFASMGVLPAAIAGAELLPRRQLGRQRQLVTTIPVAIRNIFGMYLVLTVTLTLGYFIAGMEIFDAVTYALSTASTGGMANHAESLGYFDSAAVEWIAALGMAAAGGNLLVVWWALRGRLGSVWRSTELRLYVTLLVAAFVAVAAEGKLDASDAAVAVTSMFSTTGLRSSNWGGAASSAQAVLVIAALIGAMSGSLGSGFRVARVARIVLEVKRSLNQLLYPHRVGIVRVDRATVAESSLSLTYGYLWMHVFTLAALSVLVHARDFNIVATLTFVVSIVSNVGVVVVDGRVQNFVDLSGWTEVVSSFAMVMGRLSIYPVLITFAGLIRWLERRRPRRSVGSGS